MSRLARHLFTLTVLGLTGCASGPLLTCESAVPLDARRIATQVRPGSVVTVPAGTNSVYFVQQGPIGRYVMTLPLKPTAQPVELTTDLLLGSRKRPVDVYVTAATDAELPQD